MYVGIYLFLTFSYTYTYVTIYLVEFVALDFCSIRLVQILSENASGEFLLDIN